MTLKGPNREWRWVGESFNRYQCEVSNLKAWKCTVPFVLGYHLTSLYSRRLTYSYRIPYKDHNGQEKFFGQTEELKLLSSRQHGLRDPWTLRHVLDESSPLFGLHFDEHPANKIYVFTLSVDAVQELTKSTVNVQVRGKSEVPQYSHMCLEVFVSRLLTLLAYLQ